MPSYEDYVQELKDAQKKRVSGEYTKQPGIGVGYGFGFGILGVSKKNMQKSLIHDTPHIFKENVLNNLGILTKNQVAGTKDANVVGKFFARTAGLAAGYNAISSAYNGEDGMDIASEFAQNTLTMTGVSTGLRFAGALTSKKGYRVLGGIAGGLAGNYVGEAMTKGIQDITSSRSKIGEMAKEGYSTKMYADYNYATQQALTSRQRALQQLGSSALNDRGFTLGNEASILKNTSI